MRFLAHAALSTAHLPIIYIIYVIYTHAHYTHCLILDVENLCCDCWCSSFAVLLALLGPGGCAARLHTMLSKPDLLLSRKGHAGHQHHFFSFTLAGRRPARLALSLSQLQNPFGVQSLSAPSDHLASPPPSRWRRFYGGRYQADRKQAATQFSRRVWCLSGMSLCGTSGTCCPAGGLRLAPASAELWCAMGCAAGDAAAAEAALHRALQLEPRSATAWTALGRLYAEEGGPEGRPHAASCYMQARPRLPHHPVLCHVKAVCEILPSTPGGSRDKLKSQRLPIGSCCLVSSEIRPGALLVLNG